ncbi:MAG: helix-turn-helix domain-containing protein [Firmicutes bacterium]|nr:helix-turn-helix domain-containing protein [Bacillota bacterium]
MEDISSVIGRNLGSIRKQKGLSLDKVAELTGVSKGMLAQIERGETTPTVNTVWKIATGLKVPFSELIAEQRPLVEFVDSDRIQPMIDMVEGMTVYPLFPFTPERNFEVFTVILEPGSSHSSDPHAEGAEECIVLVEGTLELTIAGEKHNLFPGDAIRYQAHKPHTYKSGAGVASRFVDIIHYSNPAR